MPELERAWPATAKDLSKMTRSEHEGLLRVLQTGVARLSKQDGYVAHTHKHKHTHTHKHKHTHTHTHTAVLRAEMREPGGQL